MSVEYDTDKSDYEQRQQTLHRTLDVHRQSKYSMTKMLVNDRTLLKLCSLKKKKKYVTKAEFCNSTKL